MWLTLALALALPTACAGRSTSLETENTAGAGSGGTGGTGGSGGSTTGSGATGATGSGATGATGSGATGATGSGATGATGSGATGATGSGATGATGAGATGATGSGGMASGGTGSGAMGGSAGMACEPELDDRRCLIDTDCRLSGSAPCCGTGRIQGVSKVTSCAQDPIACDAECAGTQWITDTKEATFRLEEVQVRCEIGEPGAGVCVSYIDLDQHPPPTYCDGELCSDSEVCVHYTAAGAGPLPPCEPPEDGGMCPPGLKLAMCPETGEFGCRPELGSPPPECVNVGATCGNPVTCDCLPPDICGGAATQCAGVMGHDVVCVDVSP